MTFDVPPDPPDLSSRAFALAMLGLVALLLGHLVARVLPRLERRRDAAAALLRVQIAMIGVAQAAWRPIEEDRTDSRTLDDIARRAAAMNAALADLLAHLRRTRRRPPAVPGADRVVDGIMSIVQSVTRVGPAPAGLARDGPPDLRSASAQRPRGGSAGVGFRLRYPNSGTPSSGSNPTSSTDPAAHAVRCSLRRRNQPGSASTVRS